MSFSLVRVQKGSEFWLCVSRGLGRLGQEIQLVLATYPTYALALTRWPIFPVLAHFSHVHHIPLEVRCRELQRVFGLWGLG